MNDSEDSSRHSLPAKFQPGQVCRGTVTSVTDFGIFVDLNGATGIVTVPNICWARIEHPSQVATVGQEVVIAVLSIDLERQQVSASLKELQQDPFLDFARHRLGVTLSGPVTKVAPVGVFIQLEGGTLGFLPASELDTEDIPEVGDALTVKPTHINIVKRQVILSLSSDGRPSG
ncbi:S1 RNA-binding domain-containing protein [Streptomyces sp. NPDC091266]|uniref:S1 RNA-binding domain-containing protein n=1 Tax=Streptomyces sp. NPDC091266 TaxID=3365978 RepID=UPI00381D8744